MADFLSGVVAGLFEIHDDLATLPMVQLAEPAIDAARNGVILDDFQRYVMGIVEMMMPRLRHVMTTMEMALPIA